MLHGGWVGAGEAVGCNVAVGAVVTGAQALRKAKNKRRGRVLHKFIISFHRERLQKRDLSIALLCQPCKNLAGMRIGRKIGYQVKIARRVGNFGKRWAVEL